MRVDISFQCVDRGTASENMEGTMSHNALLKSTDYPLRYPSRLPNRASKGSAKTISLCCGKS